MSKYSSGIQTKEKLLYSAKELFWKNGFVHTSLQQISENAGVRQSLLFYHFQNKTELARIIYDDLRQCLLLQLCEILAERDITISQTVKECLFSAAHFRIVLDHPPLLRFCSQITESYFFEPDSFAENGYGMLLSEHPEALKEYPLKFVILNNISLNAALFRAYENNYLACSKDDLIYFKLKNMLQSLCISKTALDNYITETLLLEKQFRFTVNEQFQLSFIL